MAYTPGLTAADQVYKQIRRFIFEKKFKSGQHLPEITLAKEFSVSRTPVREALRKLESEGLVQIIPGWGACLASPTRKEIFDTYEVRMDLELLSVRKASRVITRLQLCKLQEKIDEERETFRDKDLESYLDVNDAFHLTIAEAADNAALLGCIRNVLARVYVQSIFFESFFDFDTNPSLDEHIDILAALSAHDEDKCARLMTSHIQKAMTSLKSSGR